MDTGIDNLPLIDILIISHSHYDHLDEEAINNLKQKDRINVIVPLGLKSFFIERGYQKVTEIDWHESVILDDVTLTAVPSIHDSARSLADHNKTLWASWVIKNAKHNILFVGDSGYSQTLYQQIGQEYGVFDYAILPIGAYAPRELMWMSHVTPEEAVAVGVDVRANTLIASHWGTISSLSDEPAFEPPLRFKKAGADNDFTDEKLWIMKIGETRKMLKNTI